MNPRRCRTTGVSGADLGSNDFSAIAAEVREGNMM